MKVSFDFDDTLSKRVWERYANQLINRGIELWIVTSRYNPNNHFNKQTSQDLFNTADRLGIDRKNIIFTNQMPKYRYLINRGFSLHLDDDIEEVNSIKKLTEVKAIQV